MTPTIADITARYYDNFSHGGDFHDVPMAADLDFRGPLFQYADGDRYRSDCARLAEQVRSLRIRHQFFEPDRVHTVYDFDLGLPTGPIATSETLTIAAGELFSAELIIDSSPLRPAGDS